MYVSEVIADAPALNTNLRKADIIVAVNGIPVGSVDDLFSRMTGDLIGEYVTLTLLRNGFKKDIEVMPGEMA